MFINGKLKLKVWDFLLGKTITYTTLFTVLFSFAPYLPKFLLIASGIVAFSLDVVSDECVELNFASL